MEGQRQKADCRRMQFYKAEGGVRQMNESSADSVDNSSTVYNGSTSTSGASSSNAPANQPNVELFPVLGHTCPIDLPRLGNIRLLTQACIRVCVVQQHDMQTVMISGRIHLFFLQVVISNILVQSLRIVIGVVLLGSCLLDSGADSSVLPLDCANLGHAVQVDPSSKFVDAQGAPIQQRGRRRVAEVCFGSDVIIKEQFMVASVTGPIICMGRLSLKNLAPGRNQFNDDLWALETYGPRYHRLTTLCPAPTLMWPRTVWVEYQNTGWELIEYSQPVAELNDLELTVANRDKVIRIITIAHTHICCTV